MIVDQENQKESQTIEALVPMVDLFAVLAIVFMIYASDEIRITELTTASKMEEVVETLEKESQEKIQQVIDRYENDPQTVLAKEADRTAALVNKPNDPNVKNWKSGGYLDRLPKDPWGNEYLYLNPGNNGELDIYTLGRDGRPGGENMDADIGNWEPQ